MQRLSIFLLALALALVPSVATADHDSDRLVIELQREIADVVAAAREELHALHELLDAAGSAAVRRELHRKSERIDELLARVPGLAAGLERAVDDGAAASVAISTGGFGDGVAVVIRDEPHAVVVVEEHHDHSTCSESDFGSVLQAVAGETFSRSKLELLRDVSIDRWYSSSQVRRMLDEFKFDNDKVEAAVVMHPRVVDLQNWFKVHDAFTFDSSKDELRQRVGR
jgi:hypothetical protein